MDGQDYPLVLDSYETCFIGEGYYFSKGHHSVEAFIAACEAEAGPGYEVPSERVRHTWWLEKPGLDSDGEEIVHYVAVAQGTEGAYPVTVERP